jgi:hypothetical protein
LLPDGTVLFAGGTSINDVTSSAEVFNPNPGFNSAWQPQISSLSSPTDPDGDFMIAGANFRGISGGSGGTGQDSPGDYPLVQLRRLDNGQTLYLPAATWSSSSFTALPVKGLCPGWTMATLFVNGIPSRGYLFALKALSAGPPLQGTVSSQGLVLTWAASHPNRFHLLTIPDLCGTNWTDADNLVQVTNGVSQATITRGQNAGFYRLRF